jgi:putative transposase
MVSPDNKKHSIKEQCGLPGISRNAYYYEPQVPESRQMLMRRIDELYTEKPCGRPARAAGLAPAQIRHQGGRRLIRHMMDIMQIASLAPKPFLSAPDTQHKKYPYLLRNVVINHVNQV